MDLTIEIKKLSVFVLFWFSAIVQTVEVPLSHFGNHKMKLTPVCVRVSLFPVPNKYCRWEVNRKRLCSPAVTLSLCRIGKNSEELISVDLVPALMVIILSVHSLYVTTDQSER